MPATLESPPLAFFLTFSTYGSRLPGDIRGTVDRRCNIPGTDPGPPAPALEAHHEFTLRGTAVTLNAEARRVVLASFLDSAAFRRWHIIAAHIRTQHVHVVISAPHDPEYITRDLKAYATRRLREAGLALPKADVWARHGSMRYVKDIEGLAAVVHYTLYEQGEPMAVHDGRGAVGFEWSRLIQELRERSREGEERTGAVSRIRLAGARGSQGHVGAGGMGMQARWCGRDGDAGAIARTGGANGSSVTDPTRSRLAGE